MVTLTDDGNWALVANEGEPEGYCDGQTDPRGSVSVIDLRKGAARATARTASFTKYDGKEAALRRRHPDLRARSQCLAGPGAGVRHDQRERQNAYVTLQENNAVAAWTSGRRGCRSCCRWV